MNIRDGLETENGGGNGEDWSGGGDDRGREKGEDTCKTRGTIRDERGK